MKYQFVCLVEQKRNKQTNQKKKNKAKKQTNKCKELARSYTCIHIYFIVASQVGLFILRKQCSTRKEIYPPPPHLLHDPLHMLWWHRHNTEAPLVVEGEGGINFRPKYPAFFNPLSPSINMHNYSHCSPYIPNCTSWQSSFKNKDNDSGSLWWSFGFGGWFLKLWC